MCFHKQRFPAGLRRLPPGWTCGFSVFFFLFFSGEFCGSFAYFGPIPGAVLLPGGDRIEIDNVTVGDV